MIFVDCWSTNSVCRVKFIGSWRNSEYRSQTAELKIRGLIYKT